MAIFPRRVVQRLLEENSQYLAPDQVQEHVNRLNGSAVEALATEWEVAVLNVLSKIGKVRHEDSFGTPKKPDVAFYIDGVNAPEFVADVRVVSDAGLHDENPIGLLRSHLYRQLRKKGITTGGFHLSVGTLTPFPRRGEKLQLAIPKRCDLEGFVKKRLSPFFKVIVSNPSDSRAIAFDEPEIRLTIRFDPKARLAFSHHPSYTAVYDRDRNPIFNALTAKAEQLKGISFSGSKGVILCDGACTLLQPGFHSGSSFSLSHVIDRFFKSSRSIGFVLTLAAIEAPRNAPPDVASKIVGNLFTNHTPKLLFPREQNKYFVASTRVFRNLFIAP